MSTVLRPRTGSRFSLVRDYVEDVMQLIDTERCYVVMSDSWQEREMNAPAIENARGDVLCLGFGIGMILLPMAELPSVSSITVIEKEQEVLDLVMTQLSLSPKVRVIVADALRWQPSTTFDFVWDDCDYAPGDIASCEEAGERSDNRFRFAPWINPGGEYLKWVNDGRYRI